ncbi:MAG: hypothetical protein WC360_06985, partial [Opitutales bacterium]|jgi:hypothetical protein
MPDNNASGGRNGRGSAMGDGALSDKFDLGRHMLSDRTTGGSGRGPAVESARAEPANESAEGQTRTDAPTLSSSRALVGQTAAAATGGGEKAAGTVPQASASAAGAGARTGVPTLHSFDGKELAARSSSQGTANASQEIGMMRLADNSLQAIVAFARGDNPSQAGALHGGIYMQESSARNGQERQHQKREQSKEESFGITDCAAVKSDGPKASASDRLETPRMEQISQTLMEQIERIRQDGRASSVRLSIDLPDGSSLDLHLRWRGKQITARFGSNASDMRAEIENGWASLTRRAGNAGMRLEAPTFEGGDEPSFTTANHYA